MTRLEELTARFAQELERDHLADAYLLVGNAASTLQEAAFRCAGILLAATGDVRKHADLVVFDPKELGVEGLKVEHITYRKDEVPCLEQALRYRPVVSKLRAVLLFDADCMTPDAHAALLKTTEEPPADTVLFFTARELHALSPALRSRCRIWRVPQAPAEESLARAQTMGLEASAWQVLLAVYGSGEAVLDSKPGDREFLLRLRPDLQSWLEGQEDWHWCQVPAGNKLAEQRRQAALLLQAARAWLLVEHLQGGQDLLCHRRGEALDQAIDDLFGQISPALVMASLAGRGQVTQEAAS